MGAEGQAQPAGSAGHGTANSKVIPIIFVPGVMGTRLELTGTVFNWDPDDNAEMIRWAKGTRRGIVNLLNVAVTTATVERDFDTNTNLLGESVDPSGDIKKRPRLNELARNAMPKGTDTRALPSAFAVIYGKRGWGGLVWSFYGEALMGLAEQLNPAGKSGEDHPLHAFGYDWRQSNATSGKLLRDRITKVKEEHKAEKVIIVSHSMGGLVTRAAMQQGATSDILGVIHTVIPADGAVVAYRRFFTGASKDAEKNEDPVNGILGDNRIAYGLTQTGLRGPVELLPHQSYPDVFFRLADGRTSRDFPDLFSAYTANTPPGFLFNTGEKFDPGAFNLELEVTKADVDALRQKVLDAGKFAKTIAGVFHPNTSLILGDLRLTDMVVDFTKAKLTVSGIGAEAIGVKQKAGDGTVPAPSARFLTITKPRDRIAVRDAEHGKCFRAPGFIGFVVGAIRRLLADPKPP